MKDYHHTRDEQGHVVQGQGYFSCLLDNKRCHFDQSNDLCRNKNYAEKNDYDMAGEYKSLGTPYVKGACLKPCANPCGEFRVPNCPSDIWSY